MFQASRQGWAVWALTAFSGSPPAPSQLQVTQQLLTGGEAGLQLRGPNAQAETLSPAHSVPWRPGGPPKRWDMEARGFIIGYPTQVLTIWDPQPGPHSDRQTDAPGKVRLSLFPGGLVRDMEQTHSRVSQLVVDGFLSALLTHSLGPPPTPHLPLEGGVPLLVPSWGSSAGRKRRGKEGPWAWCHPGSKGSCCAGRAGFGMWATSGLCLPGRPPSHLPDHPLRNEKPASIPLSGSSVHFHLCKCDGQDGMKRKINNSPGCPVLALASILGGMGEGDKGHFPGGRALGCSAQKGL